MASLKWIGTSISSPAISADGLELFGSKSGHFAARLAEPSGVTDGVGRDCAVTDRERIVCVLTGHGLKDIDTALSTFTDLVDTVVEADVDAAAAAAGLA